MTKYFINNFAITNLHKKPSGKSEVMNSDDLWRLLFCSKKIEIGLRLRLKMMVILDLLKKKILLSFINQHIRFVF